MHNDADISLLPFPRHIERLGAWVDFPITPSGNPLHTLDLESAAKAPWLNITIGPTHDPSPESYQLRITPASPTVPPIRILAASDAGLRHALHTLNQLLKQFQPQGKLPALEIHDAPAFANRGMMLDVSRCRVPTMEHLFHVVDTIASLKFNHLQLYTEHTFAYTGHEQVWKDASPLTPDEVRSLDQHCQSRGIELAANQNCFGHMQRWLKHDAYAPLAETHGTFDFYGTKRKGPFSLCPTDPNSIKLVEDLLSQLLPCFTSKLINIGCDETADIGHGRSKQAAAERSASAIYLDFVKKVADIARNLGNRPMFWADIALNDPEALSDLPHDLIALAWGYEANTPFDNWCAALANAGLETWVCPGTSSWRSITSRTSDRIANINTAAAAGMNHNATGLLLTDWGDLGHHQQWPISLNAIAHAAQAAWNPNKAINTQATSLHLFNDTSNKLSAWLDELGDIDQALRNIFGPPAADGCPSHLHNASALFTDLHRPLADTNRPGSIDNWQVVADRLVTARQALPDTGDRQVSDELQHTLDVTDLAAARAIAIRRGLSAADRKDLASRLESIVAEHERLWQARSRPGGLLESTSHYRTLIDELVR